MASKIQFLLYSIWFEVRSTRDFFLKFYLAEYLRLFYSWLREEDAKIKLFLKRANRSNFPPYPTWFHQLLRGGYISEKFRVSLFLFPLIQYTCLFIVFLSSVVYFYRSFLFWCLGNRSNPSHSPKVFSTRKRIPEHWSLF